ncbi:hypothetical protein [Vagococcus fessus]|uniref:hypothetical protein n=1 Tax=Vagococcus fessus TaxID=120370 RepID=UPI0039EA5C79
MSKTVKVVMVASLIAPMILGAQPVSAKGKNVVSNMAIATNSQSEVEKITDEIYKTYNDTMQQKDKLKIETIKENKRDLDFAIAKLVVKLQTEFSINDKNEKSNQKLIKEVIDMRDEIGQVIKKTESSKREEIEKEETEEAEAQKNLIDENLNTSVERMNNIITQEEVAVVDNWTKLKSALKEGKPFIQITGEIKAEDIVTVKENSNVHLMGDDTAVLNIQTSSIEIPAGTNLKVENIDFTGAQSGVGFSGQGTLTLQGKINSKEGTKAPLASLPLGNIILNDTAMTLPKGILKKGTTTFAEDTLIGHLDSLNFTVTHSSIKSKAAAVFAQTADSSKPPENPAQITFNKNSVITSEALGNTPTKMKVTRDGNRNPQYQRVLSNTEQFLTVVKSKWVIDQTTIHLKSDAKKIGNTIEAPAVIVSGYEGSTMDISDSKVKVDTEHSVALGMEGKQSTINITKESIVDLHQTDDKINMGSEAFVANTPTLKFGQQTFQIKTNDPQKPINDYSRGESKIKVSGNSQLNIIKESGLSGALFLQGGQNHFTAESGSDISIIHNGDAKEDGQYPIKGKGLYAAVHFATPAEQAKDGMYNEFNVKSSDKDETYAQVNLISKSSQAISNANGAIKIVGDSRTFFTARGNIDKVGKAEQPSATIDSAGELNFKMTNMSYFDFRNSYMTDKGEPSPNARVFNTTSPKSILESIDSDLAVWPADSPVTVEHGPYDVEGAPYDSWPIMSFRAKGAGFKTLEDVGTGKNPELNERFVKNYAYYAFDLLSRLTANNQAPIINQLRVPTNADKFIYGHAKVPEGKFDEPRDAYPNEVYVEANLISESGEKQLLEGVTVEDDPKTEKPKVENVLNGKTVYGEPKRAGIFEIPVPDGKFLEQGQKIELEAAWRSVKNPDEGVHVSGKDELTAPYQTVQDVTPPDTPHVDKDKIYNFEKELTGYAKEPGTIKLARGESEILNTQTETETKVTEGKGYKFTLPLPPELNLQKGEILTVLSRNTDQPLTRHEGDPDYFEYEMPNINPVTFDGVEGNITPIDGPMEYHDRKGEDGFKQGAKVEVLSGLIDMKGNPNFDFGCHAIDTVEQTYYPEVKGKDLIVTDTLGEESHGWSLLLQDVTKEKNPLVGNLYYKKNKDDKPMKITKNASEVANKADSKEEVVNITGSWVKEETGLYTVLPVLDQVPGDFTSTLNWSLVKGVANYGQ